MATVAIVGRKNVGKSRVFNRLLGMRLSIVYKEPGVTRDRIYGEVNWCGRNFNIIDTGGFFPDEGISLAKKINCQIGLALNEADLIYFVVDAKSGLTPSDEEISKELRKINKPIFLLVNKIDNKKNEPRALEFYGLGFERNFLVSAEFGIGFGEVMDETIKMIPDLKKTKEHKVVKILILGRPNAGKSTLLNAIIKEERAIVDEKPGTTRDLINAKFIYNNKPIEIIDTGGIKRRSRIKEPIEFYSMMRAIRVIDYADVVILIFDVTQGVVKEDCHIASLILAKAKGFVIAANKIDLINKKDVRKIIPAAKQSFEFIDFVPIVLVSAKHSKGVEELLNTLLNVHMESAKLADKAVLDNLTRSLQPPPGGLVLKLAQIGQRPPSFRVTVTTSVRENYVKYIRNSIRNYFGFWGIPILIKTKVTRNK